MASKWLLPTACAVLLLTITTTYAQDNPVEEVGFFFFPSLQNGKIKGNAIQNKKKKKGN